MGKYFQKGESGSFIALLLYCLSIIRKFKKSGGYRIRTGDLLHAMQALYQLS
jgi:hypothetical protein